MQSWPLLCPVGPHPEPWLRISCQLRVAAQPLLNSQPYHSSLCLLDSPVGCLIHPKFNRTHGNFCFSTCSPHPLPAGRLLHSSFHVFKRTWTLIALTPYIQASGIRRLYLPIYQKLTTHFLFLCHHLVRPAIPHLPWPPSGSPHFLRALLRDYSCLLAITPAPLLPTLPRRSLTPPLLFHLLTRLTPSLLPCLPLSLLSSFLPFFISLSFPPQCLSLHNKSDK